MAGRILYGTLSAVFFFAHGHLRRISDTNTVGESDSTFNTSTLGANGVGFAQEPRSAKTDRVGNVSKTSTSSNECIRLAEAPVTQPWTVSDESGQDGYYDVSGDLTIDVLDKYNLALEAFNKDPSDHTATLMSEMKRVQQCYWNRWQQLQQEIGMKSTCNETNAFDHFVQCGAYYGLRWGCGAPSDVRQKFPQTNNATSYAKQENGGCRNLGCCIHVLEFGPNSTEGGSWDRQSQNGQEYFLHQGFRASEFRTNDIMEADAIFVASYDTYRVVSAEAWYCGKRKDFGKPGCKQGRLDLESVLGSKQWKSRGGDNFVFTAGHPLGWSYAELQGKGIRLQVDASMKALYGKSNILIPYIAAENGNKMRMRVGQAVGSGEGKLCRDRVLFFAGKRRGKIRERLIPEFAELTDATKRDDIVVLGKPHAYSMSAYQDVIRTSQFCLCLPGDTRSAKRDFEVASLGCIPVYVGHPPDALPFSQEIAYQDFALFFEAEATAKEIMDTIDKISSEEQALRRRKMMKAIPIADLHNKQSIATLARHICEAAKNSTNSSTLR